MAMDSIIAKPTNKVRVMVLAASTPAIIIVSKGHRETINGGPPYPSLKAYLESKL